jgi:hypothetical protein
MRAAAGFTIALAGWLSGGSALACSCHFPTADELLRSSAAIFTGTAKESVPATQGESVTLFQVVNGYKGVASGQPVRIRHKSGSSASCGVKFEAGQSYTVSTYREEIGTTLFANLCSVAVFNSPAGQELLRRLGATSSPPPPGVDPLDLGDQDP